MSRTLTLALALSFAPAIAAADDSAGVHDFATLDRATGQTDAGAELSFITGDLGAGLSGAVSRLDLHGQYMLPAVPGLGFYGSFAVSKSFLSADGMPGTALDATALSNVELGVQYRRELTSELSLVGHAGLVLPTAQQNDLAVLLVNAISAERRLTDIATVVPGITALRLGVSPTWSHGAVFARADIGADFVVDSPMGASSDAVVHANIAVGARTGKLSGAAEVVTMAQTGDVQPGEDRFLHTAALSLRYDAGRLSPNLSLVTPLDDKGRGDIFAIGAGIAAQF